MDLCPTVTMGRSFGLPVSQLIESYRLELEETLKIIQFKPPAMGRDATH